MSAIPNYQLRLGDTAPALECMLTELPGDLDNSTVRLLFKLPGATSEQVRNATSFDVATGTARYQWEASDFPVGTKTGRVAVRWEFLTTAGKRGTTTTETFTIVA